MSHEHTDPPRWKDAGADTTSPEGRAGDRFRRLVDPEQPAAAALERIRREVLRARSWAPRGVWVRRFAFAGAALVLAAGSAMGSWALRSARQGWRGSLAVADGGVGRLARKDRYRIAVVGGAEVAVGDRGAGSFDLMRGTLVIETLREPAEVRIGDVVIDVAAGSLSAIERRGAPPSVAALAGAVVVRMEPASGGVRAAIPNGQVWSRDGLRPIEAGAVSRARGALDGDPSVSPGAMGSADGRSPTAATAPPTKQPATAPPTRLDAPTPAAARSTVAKARPAPVAAAAPARGPEPDPAAAVPLERPPAAAAAPVVVQPDPTSAEAAAFALALQRLRRDGDARAALRLLDDYDRRYPRGQLAGEATLARIEAHLALGDAAGALRLLDRAGIDGLPRSADLRVLRGELRSDAGRCLDAIGDFAAVVTTAAAPTLRGRALHGRAVCLAQLGRAEEARADARLYLSLLPQGKFAAEMRRALQSDAAP
jgi:hypothetical protein